MGREDRREQGAGCAGDTGPAEGGLEGPEDLGVCADLETPARDTEPAAPGAGSGDGVRLMVGGLGTTNGRGGRLTPAATEATVNARRASTTVNHRQLLRFRSQQVGKPVLR